MAFVKMAMSLQLVKRRKLIDDYYLHSTNCTRPLLVDVICESRIAVVINRDSDGQAAGERAYPQRAKRLGVYFVVQQGRFNRHRSL